MMCKLTALYRQRERYEADFQDQMDLVRWEDDGGAPDWRDADLAAFPKVASEQDSRTTAKESPARDLIAA
jgi:hypothetical protein